MPKVPARINVSPLTTTMYEKGVRGTRKESPFDVVRARYLRAHDFLELTLRQGTVLSIPRAQISELADADPLELRKIEIQPGGDGLSVPRLDVDIRVPGLLIDLMGPLFAKGIGRRSRGATSETKAAASRVNGKRGGRPKRAIVSA
jgi:hypothetical protein